MTEDEAREWVASRHGIEVADHIQLFLTMVAEENGRQNLIAASTVPTMWSRHAIDSLQLLKHVQDDPDRRWIDVGTGGGFPGMVVALAWPGNMLLIEPRRKRAEFLGDAVRALGLADRVQVVQQRMERVTAAADYISARAVAGIEALFEMAHRCSSETTRWLLPRGHVGEDEIDILRRRWRFMFHVEHSEVADESRIAIFDRVVRR